MNLNVDNVWISYEGLGAEKVLLISKEVVYVGQVGNSCNGQGTE